MSAQAWKSCRPSSRTDADIGVISANVFADGLETLPYTKVRLVLVVPERHPLAVRTRIQYTEVRHHDFIRMDVGAGNSPLSAAETETSGQALRERLRVGNLDALYRMVEAGVGIAILPELFIRRHAPSSRTRILQIEDSWATRELLICVRSREALPPFLHELVNIMVNGAPSQIS